MKPPETAGKQLLLGVSFSKVSANEPSQGGADRAEYGAGLLKELAKKLTAEFGRGFTVANFCASFI